MITGARVAPGSPGAGRPARAGEPRRDPGPRPVEHTDKRPGPDGLGDLLQRQRAWGNQALAAAGHEAGAAGTGAVPAGTGRALAPAVRAEMEAQFGSDLGPVRIREDAGSDRAAQHLGAVAYTVGNTIGFGAGRYRPGTPEGAALLAHEITHVIQQRRTGPRVQLARLTDWAGDRAAVVTDAQIRATNEYRSYLDPALTWQTVDHVSAEEALRACRYMLAALRNGVMVVWASHARRFLNRARGLLKQIGTLAATQQTWLEGKAKAAGRTVGDQIHSVAQAGGYGGGPAPNWDARSAASQAAWTARANAVIAAVVASVRGTPLERLVAARGIVADPRTTETLNAFAFYTPADNRLHVGEEWIGKADTAAGGDPRNVHDNIAHELGGHFEYGQYGTGMAQAVTQAVLDRLPAGERARANAGPRPVYSAYGYMETELFAELREHGLRRPGSGGDLPSADVPRQLRNLRDRFAPAVAEAIVLELHQRVHEATNITPAAKTLFDTSAKTVFPTIVLPVSR